MVDISRVNAHAIALVVQSHTCGILREAALAIVPEKLVDLVAIVGDIQVHIPIVVRIKKQRAHANARIHRPRWEGDVLKTGSFEVAEHRIVAVDVDNVQVQPSVAVDVGRMQAPARPGVPCIPCVRNIRKGAVSVVEVEAVGIQVIAGD